MTCSRQWARCKRKIHHTPLKPDLVRIFFSDMVVSYIGFLLRIILYKITIDVEIFRVKIEFLQKHCVICLFFVDRKF